MRMKYEKFRFAFSLYCLRTIFQKNGGSLGTQGVASHNFQQMGVIKIERSEASEEKIFEF